jgi:hypothetical protein
MFNSNTNNHYPVTNQPGGSFFAASSIYSSLSQPHTTSALHGAGSNVMNIK